VAGPPTRARPWAGTGLSCRPRRPGPGQPGDRGASGGSATRNRPRPAAARGGPCGGARADRAQRRRARRLARRGVRPRGRGQARAGGGPAHARHRKAGEGQGWPGCAGPAERAAADYSLVSWVGPVPEEYIEQAAAVYNGMADAPRDTEIAHEEWDAQRVRERSQRPAPAVRDARLRGRGAARRHGELGGLTEVSVDPADPGWGFQAVSRW